MTAEEKAVIERLLDEVTAIKQLGAHATDDSIAWANGVLAVVAALRQAEENLARPLGLSRKGQRC